MTPGRVIQPLATEARKTPYRSKANKAQAGTSSKARSRREEVKGAADNRQSEWETAEHDGEQSDDRADFDEVQEARRGRSVRMRGATGLSSTKPCRLRPPMMKPNIGREDHQDGSAKFVGHIHEPPVHFRGKLQMGVQRAEEYVEHIERRVEALIEEGEEFVAVAVAPGTRIEADEQAVHALSWSVIFAADCHECARRFNPAEVTRCRSVS